MTENAPSLHVFKSHLEADQAIKLLSKAGFDMKKLSLVGKGYHTEEHPVGFYTVGDRIKAWGGMGAFWGGMWGLLFAPAIFFLPGLGLIALAGPLVASLVGALEGAVIAGGVSALGAALSQAGVPRDKTIKYESALKMDKYILLVHGGAQDIEKATSILEASKAVEAA